MTDTERAVADLQSRWYTLHDLDRAQSIKSIHESGMSLKELAPLLNCSPSLLSRLLRAGRAPVGARVLARRGTLSTRALLTSYSDRARIVLLDIAKPLRLKKNVQRMRDAKQF